MTWIGLLNETTGMLEVKASDGSTGSYVNKLNININDELLGSGPAGTEIKTGKHFISNDIENDENMKPWQAFAPEHGYKSAITMPLSVYKKSVGVIAIYSNQKDFFDENEVKLLRELAMDISFAIEYIDKDKKRKKAEEELKKSEALYRDLFENTPVGIFRTSSEGKVVNANPEMARIFGFDEPESAQRYKDLAQQLYVNPDERKKFLKELKENGYVNHFEFEGVRKDGKHIRLMLDARVSETKEDGTFLIDGFATEITQRKTTEIALKASEDKYRTLYNSIRDVILIADTDRNIVDCNSVFEELFGYTLDEIKGKKTLTVYNDKGEYEALGKAVKKNTNNPGFYFTVNYRTKEGNIFPGETNIFYIKDAAGKVKNVAGLIHNITHRKKIEEELVSAKEEAEKANRLKSEFLAQMSHEIRSPINAVLNSVFLIEEDLNPDANNDIKEFFPIIHSAGSRIIRTIDSILNMSELQTGTYEPEFKELHFENDIYKDLKYEFSPSQKKRD